MYVGMYGEQIAKLYIISICMSHNCGYMPLVSQKLTNDYARWGCGESGAMGAELRGRIKSVVTGTVHKYKDM